ncbi:MAG: permease prefix domain 1-containing protein [Deinococcus sp.]|nr:permease prefix domain 1-containing protein [Deinococcus sp.]
MSRTLSLYIYRATLGLPREERREVAAELRSHLLDRVRQLEAEGFEREEAEHLAVRAMGSPEATNSELLGHFFTTPLGWAVAALTALGLGGYWAWQNVPLPLLGQPSVKWEDKLNTDDLAFLMQREEAPRAPYKAVTLSIPAKTPWLYIALLPRTGAGVAQLQITPIGADPRGTGGAPANAAVRGRFLLSGMPWEDRVCPRIDNKPQLNVFSALRPLSPQNPLEVSWLNGCTGITLPQGEGVRMWSLMWEPRTSERQSLRLNEWTVLAAYRVGISTGKPLLTGANNPHDYLLAAMPADRRLDQPDPGEPKNAPNHSINIMLDGSKWAKYARGLPRPTLKP